MKLTKTVTIEIDLEAERKRIDSTFIEMNKMGEEVELPLYNKKERKYLHKLVDLFEVGDMEDIRVLMKTVPDDWWEYHCTTIDKVIQDYFVWGAKYTIVKD